MTQIAETYEGDEGYLFLTGGRHDVLAFAQGHRRPRKADVERFRKNQKSRADYCAGHGIHYAMWVFPDKLYAMRRMAPALGEVHSLFQSAYAGAVDRLPVFYPIAPLEGIKACFTRGDTHYSPYGEIVVTAEIVEQVLPGMGEAFRAIARPTLTEPTKVKGDLARKQERPLKENILKPAFPWPMERASNGLRGNDGLLEILENPDSVTDKTVLIFGDSFFRTILPFLSWAFRRIVFCRTRYFHEELVPAVRPDVILGGSAERYLSAQALDADRLHFFSYPLALGRPIKPEPGFDQLFGRAFDKKALLSSTTA